MLHIVGDLNLTLCSLISQHTFFESCFSYSIDTCSTSCDHLMEVDDLLIQSRVDAGQVVFKNSSVIISFPVLIAHFCHDAL